MPYRTRRPSTAAPAPVAEPPRIHPDHPVRMPNRKRTVKPMIGEKSTLDQMPGSAARDIRALDPRATGRPNPSLAFGGDHTSPTVTLSSPGQTGHDPQLAASMTGMEFKHVSPNGSYWSAGMDWANGGATFGAGGKNGGALVTVNQHTTAVEIGGSKAKVGMSATNKRETTEVDDAKKKELVKRSTATSGGSGAVTAGGIGATAGTSVTETTETIASGDTKKERSANLKKIEKGAAGGNLLQALDKGSKRATGRSATDSYGGSLNLGVVGVGIGKTVQASNGVAAARDKEGKLTLDYDMSLISKVKGDLTLLGFGIGAERRNGEGHAVTFEVDEKKLTPEAREELEKSLKSGVLPGAFDVKGKFTEGASNRFREAETKLAEIDQKIAAIQSGDSSGVSKAAQILLLQTEASEHKEKMRDARNTLNAQWMLAHDAGAEVLPGVKVEREVEAATRGGAISLETPLGAAASSGDTRRFTRTTHEDDDGKVVETYGVGTKDDNSDRSHGTTFDSNDVVTLSQTKGDTVKQAVTAEQLKELAKLQNGKGNDLFARRAGRRMKRMLEGDRKMWDDPREIVRRGGVYEGIGFDLPTGMSSKDVGKVFGGIRSLADLKKLKESHPEQAGQLQAHFVKGAVLSGALDKDPARVLGMLGTIEDPKLLAKTAAEAFYLISETGRGDVAGLMKEFHRLAASNPELAAQLKAQVAKR